ncbi:hypothetical protein CRYUN_Cryun38cG0011000 [Craigia yunnanensis]
METSQFSSRFLPHNSKPPKTSLDCVQQTHSQKPHFKFSCEHQKWRFHSPADKTLLSCLPYQSLKPLKPLGFFQLPTRRRLKIKASSSSANPSGSGSNGFSWLSLGRSLRLGSEQFWSKFGESVKKETGFDLDEANVRVGELVGRVNDGFRKGEGEFTRFRTELVPEFVSWNKWECWKDFKNWEPKRITTWILYIFVAIISCQKLYAVMRAPQLDRETKQLTEVYMAALILEPPPNNIRKFKKSLWRKTTPKGLKLKKFIEGPNGMLIHDSSYVGENAWDDDPESYKENVKQIIDSKARLNAKEKEELRKDLGISGKSLVQHNELVRYPRSLITPKANLYC